MIVDMHAHLIHPDTHSQAFWDGWVETAALLANRPPERVRQRLPDYYDLSGDMIIQEMDKVGIDVSVLIVNDWGTARYRSTSCSDCGWRGRTCGAFCERR